MTPSLREFVPRLHGHRAGESTARYFENGRSQPPQTLILHTRYCNIQSDQERAISRSDIM